MIALLGERKADLVTLLHQKRNAEAEIRRGKRVGKGDYLITWELPDRPNWVDEETYSRMPEKLELRLIQVKIPARGFRPKSLNIVTTLTDYELYRVDDLASLSRERVHQLRRRLSDPSFFMAALCEHIARRSNREDGCSGTFWEDRFGCRELADEAAIIVCGIYIDLNPNGIAANSTVPRYSADKESRRSSKAALRSNASRRRLPSR